MTSLRNEPSDRPTAYVKSDAPSPMANIVAALDGGPYYLISEASSITGVPVSTLRRWYKRGPERGGTRAPSKVHKHMGITVYLYTEDDLAEINARVHPTKEGNKS
jgi:hypothetical protein